MKEAIRLTNKTAIALRKSAQKTRTAYFAAAVMMSITLGAAGIVLGFLWLPAVPLMIALITLMDCALMTASRTKYLSLVGQAICTEAAARELGAAGSEKKRREQHEQDRMRIKADLDMQMEKAPGKQPFFEEKNHDEEDDDLLGEPVKFAQPEIQTKDAQTQHRRRRQNPLTIIRSEQAK